MFVEFVCCATKWFLKNQPSSFRGARRAVSPAGLRSCPEGPQSLPPRRCGRRGCCTRLGTCGHRIVIRQRGRIEPGPIIIVTTLSKDSIRSRRAFPLTRGAGHLRLSHRFVSVAVLNILITVTTLSEDSSRGDRRPLHTRDPGGCVQRTQFPSTSIRRDMNAKSLSRAPRTRGAAHLPCSKTTS